VWLCGCGGCEWRFLLALRLPSLLSFFPLPPPVSPPPNQPATPTPNPTPQACMSKYEGVDVGMATVYLGSLKTRESRASSHAAGEARPLAFIHPSHPDRRSLCKRLNGNTATFRPVHIL